MSRLPILGTCARCGLHFGGQAGDRAAVAELVGLHERHCAGDDRSAETWFPFRAVYESRARRVLLVDDDLEVRVALRALLESRGHRVTVYGNGESHVICELKWRYRHTQWPIADGVAAQLKNADHTAWAVHDAARSADVIHLNDAVIDIGLPGLDGYELAYRLRALTRHAVPRLIAFTGYGRQEDRARARRAGFDEFVLKPGEPAEIEALVACAPRRVRPD